MKCSGKLVGVCDNSICPWPHTTTKLWQMASCAGAGEHVQAIPDSQESPTIQGDGETK